MAASTGRTCRLPDVWRRPGGIIGAGANDPFDWREECATPRLSSTPVPGRT